MDNKTFDCMLFGNGLTINFLNQLKKINKSIPNYILNFSDFAKHFVEGKFSYREKKEYIKAFFSHIPKEEIVNMEMHQYFIKGFVDEFGSDFEIMLGELVVESNLSKIDESEDVKIIVPFLYNFWSIQLMKWIETNHPFVLRNFCASIRKIIGDSACYVTTNFDLLTEKIKPQHLHGRFLAKFNSYEDMAFKIIPQENLFYYKYIWGHNGIGKNSLINKLKTFKNHEKWFDFDFFEDSKTRYENILIYGLGFRVSGYMKGMEEFNEKYKKPAVGGIIDEHILVRLREMQGLNLLNKITFAYYGNDNKSHYEHLADIHKLENVEYIKSSDLGFSIEIEK